MIRRNVSLAALILLTGCTATPDWNKPGVAAAVRDKDLAACRQDIGYVSDEARRRDTRIAAARGEIGASRNGGYDALRSDLDASAERRRENKALADCMRAKGYTIGS